MFSLRIIIGRICSFLVLQNIKNPRRSELLRSQLVVGNLTRPHDSRVMSNITRVVTDRDLARIIIMTIINLKEEKKT